MQSRAISGAIAVALVAAAVVLFVVLRGDDGNGDEPATTTPAAAEQSDKQAKRTKPKPKVPTIVVKNGEPVGGVQELEHTRGEKVRFEVKSDVAEHVHVHGYDLIKDVVPGKVVRFGFPAEIEGGFEVELEGSHTQIAELTVEPG